MLEVLSTKRDLGEQMFKVDIERLPSFQIGEERGLERGLEKGLERVAKKLLTDNKGIAYIVDLTGLSIVAVEKLKEKSKLDEK